MLMQIYADVTGRVMQVARSGQACALGAAIAAAVLAGAGKGGHSSFAAAQAAMTGVKERVYKPHPGRHAVYERLYALYLRLHDAFGGRSSGPMGDVMKELLSIREEQIAGSENAG